MKPVARGRIEIFFFALKVLVGPVAAGAQERCARFGEFLNRILSFGRFAVRRRRHGKAYGKDFFAVYDKNLVRVAGGFAPGRINEPWFHR